MCTGQIGPFPVVLLPGTAPRPAAPGAARYNCRNCGAPLFGLMNENCQYCATRQPPPLAEVTIANVWPDPAQPALQSGGGGDFAGGGATGSWEVWDSGPTNTGNGE